MSVHTFKDIAASIDNLIAISTPQGSSENVLKAQ
jgi:phosphoheptose isomerase